MLTCPHDAHHCSKIIHVVACVRQAIDAAAPDELPHHFEKKLHGVRVHQIESKKIVHNVTPFLSRTSMSPHSTLAYFNKSTAALHQGERSRHHPRARQRVKNEAHTANTGRASPVGVPPSQENIGELSVP